MFSCEVHNSHILSGSRERARIGLNSVHSVILLLIRERAVRFFSGAMALPFTIMGGWKILPKSGEGVGEGHPESGDWRKDKLFEGATGWSELQRFG